MSISINTTPLNNTPVTISDLGNIIVPAHPSTLELTDDYALPTDDIRKSTELRALLDTNNVVMLNNGSVVENDVFFESDPQLIDQDSMAADRDDVAPTQQSVKAYVDNSVASVGGSFPFLNVSMNDTTDLAFNYNVGASMAEAITWEGTTIDQSNSLISLTSAFTVFRANFTGHLRFSMTASIFTPTNTSQRTGLLVYLRNITQGDDLASNYSYIRNTTDNKYDTVVFSNVVVPCTNGDSFLFRSTSANNNSTAAVNFTNTFGNPQVTIEAIQA